MELEAANLMAFRAAALYDAGEACGAEANAAKYLAAEAAFKTCETALMTHGGMGYAKEFHVERYLRKSLITRIAPVTPHMIMNFIAEKVLGPCRGRIEMDLPPPSRAASRRSAGATDQRGPAPAVPSIPRASAAVATLSPKIR